jgi:hypothetical protein
MNRLFVLFVSLFWTICAFSQAPSKISYQAVVRDAANKLLVNGSVGLRISILQNSNTGTAVYVETQTSTTNNNGLVSIQIGAGTVTSGVFTDIDWKTGIYFIKTETDPLGGTNYTITGTSQILSVPYALYAEKSGNPATIKEVADEFTATTTQTSFNLTQLPSVNSKVKMYINGIRISNLAYSITGALLTYTPANNGSYNLVSGDRIQFDYYY